MSGQANSAFQELSEIPEYRRREILTLVGYIFAILICIGWVATMLSRAYWNQGLFYELRWFATDILNLEVATLPGIFIGYLLGLTLLVVLDWYKRIHGVLLLISMVIASVVLLIFQDGAFVGNISWTSGATPLMIFGGLSIGLIVGGGVQGFQKKPWRFDSALVHIGAFITFFLILGIIDAHFLYDPPFTTNSAGQLEFQSMQFTGFIGGTELLIDVALSSALLFFFVQFAGHDTGKKIIVLGPTGSGKTWLLTGLGYVITKEWGETGFQTEPDGKLIEMMNTFAFGNFDDDVFQGTRDARYLWFTYPHGVFFRKEIGVQTLDYPGEVLKFVESVQSEDVEANSMREALIEAQDASTNKSIAKNLSEAVFYADTVATLIPLDDFGDAIEQRGNVMYGQDSISPPRDRISPDSYTTGYHHLAKDYNDKDFVPVVTKADLARKDFIDQTPYDTTTPNYYKFRAYIQENIIDTSLDVYLNEIDEKVVYPVYFAVDEDDPFTESGNINPNLTTDDTEPVLRGSIELLQRLGR
jgi:energy-coupling factor transporter ATP-binding protein EcfA2